MCHYLPFSLISILYAKSMNFSSLTKNRFKYSFHWLIKKDDVRLFPVIYIAHFNKPMKYNCNLPNDFHAFLNFSPISTTSAEGKLSRFSIKGLLLSFNRLYNTLFVYYFLLAEYTKWIPYFCIFGTLFVYPFYCIKKEDQIF